MPSSFNGQDLFGSGPHRFQEGRRGYLVLPDESAFTPTTNNIAYGVFELQVFVRGRLVSSSESGLWAIRDALQTALDAYAVSALRADLVDGSGRTWEDMTFVRLEVGEEIDRGRVVSVPYEARFHRFTV